jgi:cell division protein FtsL
MSNDTSAYKITEDEEYTVAEGLYGGYVNYGGYDGSAAPALPEPEPETAPEPEYIVPSEDELYVFEQEQRRGNAVLHEIKLKKQRRKAKNGILFKVSLLLALGLIVGVRFASITEINYRNQSLQKQLDTVNSEVQRRRVELDSAMSLTQLAETAENELGMQKPQPYQIKYVSVERIDQTELADVELTGTTDETTWLERIRNSVLEFLGITR